MSLKDVLVEGAPGGPRGSDGLTAKDMLPVISACIRENGLVNHHMEGYNALLESGLGQVMAQQFFQKRTVPVEAAAGEAAGGPRPVAHRFSVQFHSLEVARPMHCQFFTGQNQPLFPGQARLAHLPYCGDITVSATVTLAAVYADGHEDVKTVEVPPFLLGGIPIMTGSVRCHTQGPTRTALRSMGENPEGIGCDFIVKGNEYAPEVVEHLPNNEPQYRLAQKPSERVRVELLSQMGSSVFDGSSQLKLVLHADGRLTAELNSVRLEKATIPFVVLYRLFGMWSDREVVETIVYDVEGALRAARGEPGGDALAGEMVRLLEPAFHLAQPPFAELLAVTDPAELLTKTAERLQKSLPESRAYAKNDDALRYINTDLLHQLDEVVLPHLGLTAEARPRKLRFIGELIRRCLLIHLRQEPPTDRDSYASKRLHGAGSSMAKTFKTHVTPLVSRIVKALRRLLQREGWAGAADAKVVAAVHESVSALELQRGLEQAIVGGNTTIVAPNGRAAVNRMSMQLNERKNPVGTLAGARMVITLNHSKAKGTARANEMRRLHATQLGYICVAQSSPTGENVGINKQLAVTAGVTNSADTLPLRAELLADPLLVPLDAVAPAAMAAGGLAPVYLNGEWLGCAADTAALAAKYRALRRAGRVVDPHATVAWSALTGRLEFWLDAGRLYRPLLVVRSNRAAFEAAHRAAFAAASSGVAAAPPPSGDGDRTAAPPPFEQDILYTAAHAAALRAGTLTFEDLRRAGVLEYVTVGEQTNCLVAETVDVLRAHRHDAARQYTHCDIAQAIFGIPALTSPYGDHTQPVRVTYQTSQGRQACYWYVANFADRIDDGKFFQLYVERPVVSTIAYAEVPCGGVNMVVAYMCAGNNQEDSAIISAASADLGLVSGVYYRRVRAELERGEAFGVPDPVRTHNLKPGASYALLDADGVVRPGTAVRFGDVLVGRIARLGGAGGAGAAAAAPALPGAFGAPAEFTDRSLIYRYNEPATVGRVARPRGPGGELVVIVQLVFNRSIRTGDKLSSRMGNKSIGAELRARADMPYTRSGVTPDLIVNPHSFPKRMAVGQLIETAVGKAAATFGRTVDGTAFLPVDYGEVAADLAAAGFRPNGRETLFDGVTGEHMDVAIFIGPTLQQRLLKFVLDEKQVHGASAPTDALTGQPQTTRTGEMEGWCMMADGTMWNMHEKYFHDSDGRLVYFCRGCGREALYNRQHRIYACRNCSDYADIACHVSSKSATLFRHELAAANIDFRVGSARRAFTTARAVAGFAAP